MAETLHDNQLRLARITIGDIDAKNEILKQHSSNSSTFMNGFFVPANFDQAAIDAGNVMFVVGFKGTGKTSLLRWLGNKKRQDGHKVHFLLFKTQIKEEDRQTISRGIWFEFLPVKQTMTGIEQDFKYAWAWILVEKLFSALTEDKSICTKTPKLEELAKIIGYDVGSGHSVLLKQHLSIMPKIASGKVEISAKSPIAEGKVGLEITTRDKVLIPFGELVRAAEKGLCDLTYTGKKLFLYVDELEAFSGSRSNFERDIRMIRDLLSAVHELNSEFRTRNVPIYIMAAVRSEVMSVVNRTGEEVGRTVEDFCFRIDWGYGDRGHNHPLIQLVKQKIRASEIEAFGRQKNMDPIKTYFPAEVLGVSIGRYLLDATMYRPRDLVRRLGLVKKRDPTAWNFSEDALRGTFGTYSEQLWQEVAEELVPGYEVDQVTDLGHALRGFRRYFYRRQFEEVLRQGAASRPALRRLLGQTSPQAVLHDLFRLGVIGNNYRVGDANRTRTVDRWSFREAHDLDLERRMTFHRALWPHLALVSDQPRTAPPTKPIQIGARRR